jgi:hypothetical protein
MGLAPFEPGFGNRAFLLSKTIFSLAADALEPRPAVIQDADRNLIPADCSSACNEKVGQESTVIAD